MKASTKLLMIKNTATYTTGYHTNKIPKSAMSPTCIHVPNVTCPKGNKPY